MQPIILKLSEMENPKDFLSKEELNLVTGGISPSGIFANNEGDAGRGPSCDAGCKRGCVLVVDLAVLLDVFLFPEKMVIRHLKAIFERVVSQSYHSFNFVFIVSYFNSIFNFNIIKKYEPNIYFES